MQIICFCHLRWNFVYQRPQHILTRFGKRVSVHVWEEPLFESRDSAHLLLVKGAPGVTVVTPILPYGLSKEELVDTQRRLLDDYLASNDISEFVAWYYTPMALQFSEHLQPATTVYDSMDELSAFQGAPPELLQLEQMLFARADAVFAGGASLYASKRGQHPNVHLFPSSIDFAHFSAARQNIEEPADQISIPRPRIGFYGVLDERLDRELLRDLSAAHPNWSFVLIGPVVKIREQDLPRANNLHYLGQRSYSELPRYLGHWNVAMLPFALNASTRFISPTKTPEYLAAGKPVVSTPIHDVVVPYGHAGLVSIGANALEFGDAIEISLMGPAASWLKRVDRFLSGNSWDKTFEGMWDGIQRCAPQQFRQDPQLTQQSAGERYADV